MRTETTEAPLPDSRAADRLLDLDMVANRSLSPRGARLLGGGILLVLGLMALRAQMVGAWPITAFLVADAALFTGLFLAFLRRPAPRERLVIAGGMLILEQQWPGGVRLAWPAGWVRMEPAGDDPLSPILLSYGGQRIEAGSCLAPAERADIRPLLRRALDRARTA